VPDPCELRLAPDWRRVDQGCLVQGPTPPTWTGVMRSTKPSGGVVHRWEAHIGPEVDMREPLQQRWSSALGHPGDPLEHQIFFQSMRIDSAGFH
jgi:hypothetical protein